MTLQEIANLGTAKKAEFKANGIPVSDWATAHGFRPSDVYRVLNGMSRCSRGKMHDIAVKLGIKADPDQPAA